MKARETLAAVLLSIAILGGLIFLVVAMDRYATARNAEALERLEQKRAQDAQFQRDVLLALEECDQDPDCANVPYGLADTEP